MMNRTITAVMACAVLIGAMLLPGVARADLDGDLTMALSQLCDQINGLELAEPSVDYEFYGVGVTATVVGFAMCEPTDPWAEPAATPTPPFNSYGCESVSDVEVDVDPTGDSAVVTVAFDHFFLDFEMQRDYGICIPCGECNPFGGDPVDSEGYLLGSASLSMEFTIDSSPECPGVEMVPGSCVIDLGDPTIVMRNDSCLNDLISFLKPVIIPAVETTMSEAMELFWIGMENDIEDLVCTTSPTEDGSWSGLKAQYR